MKLPQFQQPGKNHVRKAFVETVYFVPEPFKGSRGRIFYIFPDQFIKIFYSEPEVVSVQYITGKRSFTDIENRIIKTSFFLIVFIILDYRNIVKIIEAV
mmetsp:Transcript_9114/g.11381  ORF Transcript_9114/g.11381 Transcript_9114/m.11381 type:complete len:99 (-) Transcript_9114:51-347(-)